LQRSQRQRLLQLLLLLTLRLLLCLPIDKQGQVIAKHLRHLQ
jgi:hypothetical protein